MTQFGKRIVTSSVPGTFAEVCYDGGTAYLEAKRDECGMIVVGETAAIYTIDANGVVVEIINPDWSLVSPTPCESDPTVVGHITGCVEDPDNTGQDPMATVPAYWLLHSDGTTTGPVLAPTLTGFVIGCC